MPPMFSVVQCKEDFGLGMGKGQEMCEKWMGSTPPIFKHSGQCVLKGVGRCIKSGWAAT